MRVSWTWGLGCVAAVIVGCVSPERAAGFYRVSDGGTFPGRDATNTQAQVDVPSLLPGPIAMALTNPSNQEVAPPPITGGTLLALRDGQTVVAADPDRDRLWIVRPTLRSSVEVALEAGDEPGRLVEDDQGRVHIALRRGGAVVTLDPEAGRILARRPVCPAPRGVAWDDARHELLVACAGGELLSIPREGEARVASLGDDLRDVLIWQQRRFVTRFRRAELIEVDADGRVLGVATPPSLGEFGLSGPRDPGVAWRTIVHPTRGIVMLHQLAKTAPITLATDAGVRDQGAYGGGGARRPPCSGGMVESALTVFDGLRPTLGNVLLDGATLAVDLAPYGDGVAVAAPGNLLGGPLVISYSLNQVQSAPRACTLPQDLLGHGDHDAVIAVAPWTDGRMIAQRRAAGGVHVFGLGTSATYFAFGGARDVSDTGHTIFHAGTDARLACASCHPEGGEDGRVWQFSPLGPRRTPPLRGATSRTAPFHWDGDQQDIGHLLDDVFSRRMSGGRLTLTQQATLARWIDGLPLLRTRAGADAETLARGRAVFEGPAGCADCHAGPDLTNNDTTDVGTGGRFQVPPLRGLAARAPYLHDGRAPSLEARLLMDMGDRHGRTSSLTAPQRDDLLRYLESL